MNFVPGLIRQPSRRQPLALANATAPIKVPAEVDLRSQLLPTSDQGPSSKCVAYATAGLIEFGNWKFHGRYEQIAPDPIYAEAKRIDGMPGVEGTTLEAGLQAAQTLGVLQAGDNASLRTVNNAGDVMRALHRHGVVLAAFQITDGWLRAKPDGFIQPGRDSLGGHAVLLCGYQITGGTPFFALQNSWGEGQGWRGFNRITVEMFNQQFDYGLVWDWDAT